MPVFHKYVGKDGGYVRAKHGRAMVTYQITPAGEAELKRNGVHDKKKISPAELHRLVVMGLAYTNGSGPGSTDTRRTPAKQKPLLAPQPPRRQSRQTPEPYRGLPPSRGPHPTRSCPSSAAEQFFGVVCGKCRGATHLLDHGNRLWCGWCGSWATPMGWQKPLAPVSQAVVTDVTPFDLDPDFDLNTDHDTKDLPDYTPSPPPPTRKSAPEVVRKPFPNVLRPLLSILNFQVHGVGLWLWMFVIATLLFLVYILFLSKGPGQ